MKSLTEVEKLVKKFRLKPTAKMSEKTLADALKAQEEIKKTESAVIQPNIWRIIIKSRISKFSAAAIILIGALLGLYHFAGSIEMATPTFADVVQNMLSQKWVYMFEEDRRKGQISAEYWYNPSERKLYFKSHTVKGSVRLYDMDAGERYDCRDNVITISKSDDSAGGMLWLEQRIPMLGGLLSRHERDGADIVEKDAVYNGKAALLYEIEMTIPDREALRTDKFTWLVDSKTHLPIICEHTHLYGQDYNGTYKEAILESQRYAFDYCDSRPRDIYELGAPKDAKVRDSRPSPEIQELIDKINEAKETTYKSFAAVFVKDGRPNKLVIRDGRRLLESHLELNINSSDWEPKKAEHIAAMGDTFDSVFRWAVESEIMIQQHIVIVDEQFIYETSDWDIRKNERIKMERNRGRGDQDEFTRYRWWSMPSGQIVTTPYSEEHNLICTETFGGHYYYDPAKDYMCVRHETKEGRVHRRLLEFAQTEAGMWYPCKISDGTRIYARDLNDQLRAKLDPRTLPNYVDYRELTRQMKLQQAEGAQNDACIEYTGFTPLHMAIYRQDMDRVKKYLEKGAEIESAYDSGATPMELAVASGNLEMVKLLYEYGADFVSNDDEHRDALGLAAKEGFYEIAKFMLAHGSDVNLVYKAKNSPLHYAAARGDIAMIELLLAHGAEIDPRERGGKTPLYKAIDNLAGKLFYPEPTEQAMVQRFKDVITLLIENGADINARNTSKKTAMSRAISAFAHDRRNAEQQIGFLRFLLACGADPDSDAVLRLNSSFYRAAERRRYDIVEVLLQSGADPWLVADVEQGLTKHSLLHFARRRNDDKLYDMLYPYMKQRYEQTNAEVLEVALRVLWASLKDDTAAISNLCAARSEYSWKRWPKEIKKLYLGHEDLLEQMVPGWFTLDGLAEVYVPLPEGKAEKSVKLGLIQFPDGSWKCVVYRKMNYMPEYEKANRSSHFLGDSRSLDELRNSGL